MQKNQKLVVYGNIQISSKERLDTFKVSISNWHDNTNLSMWIRIRGVYGKDAINYCKKFSRIEFFSESTFLQWRNQAFSDISKINSEYVIIYLEDQLLLENQKFLNTILKSMIKLNIDVLQYSWHGHYQSKISAILELSDLVEEDVCAVAVNRESRDFLYRDQLYMISITSIFKKDFLVKLLKDRRPFLRKYDSRGPFDVEKSPNYKRAEPYIYGLPMREYAVCIDDEMGLLGSSAIARGLVNLKKTKRGVTHYSKISPKYWINHVKNVPSLDSESFKKVEQRKVLRIFKRLIEVANITANSFEFIVFELRDYRKRRVEETSN